MLFLFITIFPSVIFCQTIEKIEIGYIDNGTVILTYEQSKLLRAFEIQHGDTLQASSIECISGSEDNFYLTAKLQNNNVNMVVAEKLVREGQKIYVGAENKPVHACKGEPCSSCSIVIKEEAVWCNCNHPNGVCNHIIYYPSISYYQVLKNL